MIYFTIPDHHSNPPFGGPPGLNNDQQHIMPPFEVGLGPPMMGGHPNGGPSPPLHTGLPPLGSHLSGIEGLMDLQTVGQFRNTILENIWCSFDVKNALNSLLFCKTCRIDLALENFVCQRQHNY